MSNILFVCTANVCRSPLLAFSFRSGLSVGLGEDTRIFSRGIAVSGRYPMCSIAGSLLGESDEAIEFAQEHSSNRLASSDVAAADVIFTAGKDHKAVIARLNPAARARTFTVKEAVQLAALDAGRGNYMRGEVLEEDRATSFARSLNAQRGRPLETPTQPKPQFRRAREGVDIDDVHGRRQSAHIRGLRSARAAALELGQSFR